MKTGTDKKAKTSSSAAPSDDGSAAEAKRLGALDSKALEAVVLTGKTAGFDAKKVAKSEVEAGRGMEADKKVCQPLASLLGGFTHIKSVSVVHRSLQPAEATNATVGSMWLTSHSKANAVQVMKDLRTAIDECPKGFKTIGLTYNKVEGLKAPKLGDEAVGYRITGEIGGKKVPMTYTVVRSGGVIAAFYGMNMLDERKAAIPEPVIKAQLERLATEAG
ncbi:hypothetical protein [Streptomyces sp. NPDC001970]